MDLPLLLQVLLALAEIPFLFCVGYGLSLLLALISKHFSEEPESCDDLSGMAFLQNSLMFFFWMGLLGMIAVGVAVSPPEVRARYPDSLPGLILYAFALSWGMLGIWLAFGLVLGLVDYLLRAVARWAWQILRMCWF